MRDPQQDSILVTELLPEFDVPQIESAELCKPPLSRLLDYRARNETFNLDSHPLSDLNMNFDCLVTDILSPNIINSKEKVSIVLTHSFQFPTLMERYSFKMLLLSRASNFEHVRTIVPDSIPRLWVKHY